MRAALAAFVVVTQLIAAAAQCGAQSSCSPTPSPSVSASASPLPILEITVQVSNVVTSRFRDPAVVSLAEAGIARATNLDGQRVTITNVSDATTGEVLYSAPVPPYIVILRGRRLRELQSSGLGTVIFNVHLQQFDVVRAHGLGDHIVNEASRFNTLMLIELQSADAVTYSMAAVSVTATSYPDLPPAGVDKPLVSNDAITFIIIGLLSVLACGAGCFLFRTKSSNIIPV